MRRKFINRMFTLLLSVCLASSTLAGCGNKTAQENSVAPQEENVTIEDNNASYAEQEEKVAIRNIVNAAIAKFGISGKYAAGKEIRNKNG